VDNAKRYNNIKLAIGIGEGIAGFVLLLLSIHISNHSLQNRNIRLFL
jgi:hypothetical protein